jgi:hypothetical protein
VGDWEKGWKRKIMSDIIEEYTVSFFLAYNVMDTNKSYFYIIQARKIIVIGFGSSRSFNVFSSSKNRQ